LAEAEKCLAIRDGKPANILLEKGVERAVLTDFGLARAADDVSMTRWGIIAGTPQYMSPEQARGEPLDGRSDLFSLECVLYEMATGASPFRADSTLATLRRLIDDAPPAIESLNPELPPWFIAIVDRLLRKDPSQRFASAKGVSELLENCLAHLQQPGSVPLPAALPAGKKRTAPICRNGPPWTKPEDLPFVPEKPLKVLGNVSPTGFLAAFFDGSVRRLKVDNKTLKALITPDGGEVIDQSKLDGGAAKAKYFPTENRDAKSNRP